MGMDVTNLLEKLERVKAPPDFEQSVLDLLSERKEKKQLKWKHLRLSFAGALALLLVFFVAINVFVLQKKGALDLTDMERDIPSAGNMRPMDYIPIIEIVDYNREIQSVSSEPQTIYLLEQVSDSHREKIKY